MSHPGIFEAKGQVPSMQISPSHNAIHSPLMFMSFFKSLKPTWLISLSAIWDRSREPAEPCSIHMSIAGLVA